MTKSWKLFFIFYLNFVHNSVAGWFKWAGHQEHCIWEWEKGFGQGVQEGVSTVGSQLSPVPLYICSLRCPFLPGHCNKLLPHADMLMCPRWLEISCVQDSILIKGLWASVTQTAIFFPQVWFQHEIPRKSSKISPSHSPIPQEVHHPALRVFKCARAAWDPWSSPVHS